MTTSTLRTVAISALAVLLAGPVAALPAPSPTEWVSMCESVEKTVPAAVVLLDAALDDGRYDVVLKGRDYELSRGPVTLEQYIQTTSAIQTGCTKRGYKVDFKPLLDGWARAAKMAEAAK